MKLWGKCLLYSVIFYFLFFISYLPVKATTITLNPGVTYQTMLGWEAHPQSGANDFPTQWAVYKDNLYDQVINDLGINRLRIEVYRKASPAGPQTGNGFDLTVLDDRMTKMVLPLRALSATRGETIWLNFCVVGKGYSLDPTGYANAVLELYRHMQSTYGFLPDSWEVALEPDNFQWGLLTNVENAMIAAGDILQANGYTLPPFVTPSNSTVNGAIFFFDSMWDDPNLAKRAKVRQYLKEISYHRYQGATTANITAIGDRARNNNLQAAHLEHIGADYHELHEDLTLGHNSSWSQYTIAWNQASGDDGGKYYLFSDAAPYTIIMGSRTKFLRQYFKYIRRGAVRYSALSNDANFAPLAFKNTDQKNVVVVKAAAGGPITVNDLPAGTYGIFYTTASQYNINPSDQIINAGQSINTNIPAAGVLTVYAKSTVTYDFDINNDNKIDILDLARIVNARTSGTINPYSGPEDVNTDGKLDSADLTAFLNQYTHL